MNQNGAKCTSPLEPVGCINTILVFYPDYNFAQVFALVLILLFDDDLGQSLVRRTPWYQRNSNSFLTSTGFLPLKRSTLRSILYFFFSTKTEYKTDRRVERYSGSNPALVGPWDWIFWNNEDGFECYK